MNLLLFEFKHNKRDIFAIFFRTNFIRVFRVLHAVSEMCDTFSTGILVGAEVDRQIFRNRYNRFEWNFTKNKLRSRTMCVFQWTFIETYLNYRFFHIVDMYTYVKYWRRTINLEMFQIFCLFNKHTNLYIFSTRFVIRRAIIIVLMIFCRKI